MPRLTLSSRRVVSEHKPFTPLPALRFRSLHPATMMFAVAALCVGASDARAQSCTVTSLADDGSSGTLRYCLNNLVSGTAADTNTITFSVTGTITLTGTLPDIENGVTITGPGANLLTISGAGLYQVMTIGASGGSPTVGISELTIANGNTASSNGGGGVYVKGLGSLTVADCAFTGNQAYGDGGAISYDSGGTLDVTGSTFTGNSSSDDAGGAIVGSYYSSLVVANSTFSGNSAISAGAVFVASLSSGNFSNSTFSGNSATIGRGGAIYTQGALTSNNNIFSQNSSKSGGAGIDNYGEYPATNASYNVYYNNLTNGTEDDCNDCTSNTNATSATSNPLTLPLGYYGGTTETYLPQPGSQAICAGSASLASNAGLTTDQRGFAMNPNYLPATCVDAGAVQTNYIQVQSSGDNGDAPADCPGTNCTLQDAIGLANTSGGGNGDIDFAPGVSSIALSSSIAVGSGYDNIIGPGANQLTINGGGSSSDFSAVYVGPGDHAVLYGLTISNGNAGAADDYRGGGIYNSGSLVLYASAVTGNAAEIDGGGIINYGSLTLLDCTVSGNSAVHNGGGIENTGGAELSIQESTFSGNTTGSAGGSWQGGGIDNNGTLALTDSTIAGNAQPSASGTGGGISGGGTTTLANSIVAGNTDAGGNTANIENSYTDDGGNVVGGETNATTSLVGGTGAAISLSALQYNGIGAMVQTMISLPGSAAICAGTTANIPSDVTTDERGYPLQPANGYCPASSIDAGAVQTNYTSLEFVQQPSNVNIGAVMSPAPTLAAVETDTLLSSSNTDAVDVDGLTVTSTGDSPNFTLTDSSSLLETASSESVSAGVIDLNGLAFSGPTTGDTLAASLAVTPSNISPGKTISGTSSEFNVSAVPPSMTSPTPGSTLTGASVTFEWSAGAGPSTTSLDVGTEGAGSFNIYKGSAVATATGSATVTVPTNGATLYVTLFYHLDGTEYAIDYTYTEANI